MRSRFFAGLGLAVAPLLAGCPGADDGVAGVDAICRALGNSSHVAWSTSPSGTFDSPTLAFDGHLGSYAELSPGSSASGAISGGGLSRPAGEYAGVAFTRPRSGALTVNVTLYRGGSPVSSGQAGSTHYTATGVNRSCAGYCTEQAGVVFYAIRAQMPYDEIEASINVGGMDEPLQIRELCIVE